jgi:DNA-binding FrmR family transcriptional regulator
MIDTKQKTLISLKKAHSLISKIISMRENDEYCIKIMQQTLAAIGLLRSAHATLMENHLNTCFKQALKSGNAKKQQTMTEEILKVTNLFNK